MNTLINILSDRNDYATDVFVIVAPYVQRSLELGVTRQAAYAQLKEAGYVDSSHTFFSNGRTKHRIRYKDQKLTSVYIKPYAYTLWQEYKSYKPNIRHHMPGFIDFILAKYRSKDLPHSEPLIPKEQQIPWSHLPKPRILTKQEYSDLVVKLINDPNYQYANIYFAFQTPVCTHIGNITDTKPFYPMLQDVLNELGYTDIRRLREFDDLTIDGLVTVRNIVEGDYKYKTAVFVTEAVCKRWKSFWNKPSAAEYFRSLARHSVQSPQQKMVA